MTQDSPAEPLLSVRGEASRFVDPDVGELSATIEQTRETSRDAVEAVAAATVSVHRELERIGGVVRSAATLTHPLTWSTRRVTTSPEWDHAKGGQTGRTVASASLTIHLRDFGALAAVEQLATSVTGFRFDGAGWYVDPANPQWRAVRQEAVREAIQRARDYAEALGSSLVAVEHVADLGLLTAEPQALRMHAAAGRPGAFGSGPEATLDPVPQQLVVAVEARVRMSAVPLGS